MTARRMVWVLTGLWVVTTAPYVYGSVRAGSDRVFTGLLLDVPDHAQYWAWVTASRAGLFISNTMTPEPNPAIFMNAMMWTLAQVQRAFSLTFPALFQVWRLAAFVALGVALHLWLKEFVVDRATRRTAAWLALLGSGFGWLLIVVKTARHLTDAPFPTDIYTMEPNTFLGLLAYPYFPLSQACVLLTCVGAWRAHQRGATSGYVLAGVAAFVGTACHAYDALVIAAALGAFVLVSWIRTSRLPVRLTVAAVVAGVASAPVAFYYSRLTAGDPLWQSLLSQYANAGVWTPPHIHLVILMGATFVLAACALVTKTIPDEGTAFSAGWAVAGLALIYIPTVYQIKMLAAWQFPLAVLAATYWHARVLPRLDRMKPLVLGMRSARLATVALILVAALTNVYLYAWRFVELGRRATPDYLHVDEAQALDWLAAHTGPDDVVLAPESLGRFVPSYGQTRAYLAHWAMTNHYYTRRDEVSRFFSASRDDAWRQALLAREGVTYVVRSTADSAESVSPESADYLTEVMTTQTVQVFRVRPGGAAVSTSAPGGPS